MRVGGSDDGVRAFTSCEIVAFTGPGPSFVELERGGRASYFFAVEVRGGTWRLYRGDVPVYLETFCCNEKEVVDNRTPDVDFVPIFSMI